VIFIKKKIFDLLKRIIIAPFILYLYNLAAVGFNAIVPINICTILITGIFGIFGLIGVILYFLLSG